MVDWDEDGDIDLLAGEYDGHIHYFQNIGTVTNPILTNMGHLTCNGLEIDVTQLAIPVVHDYNEDGLKDLITGNDPAYIRYYQNFGTNAAPRFNNYVQIFTTPAITQIKNAPDIGDLNGDGLKDLAFGWWQGTVVYYPNSGTNAAPQFDSDHEFTVLGDSLDPGGWTHLELDDWDEDGDLDLIYGEWNGDVRVYYNLSGEFSAEMTPQGPPIQIPASGGSFQFDGVIENNSDFLANMDIWTCAKLPSGAETAALLQINLNMAAGGSLQRLRTQNIPASAPAGEYEYILRAGVYPEDAWAEASFPFTKLAAGDAGVSIDNWTCWGEDSAMPSEVVSTIPESPELLSCYPNPFNPSTTIYFELRQASDIKLAVYDIQGREITALGIGHWATGKHSVVWDAAGQASGMYFVRLAVDGGQSSVRKVVLMK